MHEDEFSHFAALEDAKTSKKQLQCNNALRLFQTNLQAQDFDIDDEFEEKSMLFALEAKAATRAPKNYMLISKHQQESSDD